MQCFICFFFGFFIDIIKAELYQSEGKIMEEQKNNIKPNIRDKKYNARLYPIYKMFSWDLLSYYAIEFLFLTITKRLSASQVLILTSIYIISKIIFQIPSVIISDYIGKRKNNL